MKKIIVKGRVQGVSFRLNITKFSNELGIKGYVRNLNNGDVEIIANQSAELITYCKSNPGMSHIDSINVSDYTTGEKFNKFRIK
jgi:acylphosphatase